VAWIRQLFPALASMIVAVTKPIAAEPVLKMLIVGRQVYQKRVRISHLIRRQTS
jgi:hypothetical protein